jgi:hypothetical protein
MTSVLKKLLSFRTIVLRYSSEDHAFAERRGRKGPRKLVIPIQHYRYEYNIAQVLVVRTLSISFISEKLQEILEFWIFEVFSASTAQFPPLQF